MTFKSQMVDDLQTFVNVDEFAVAAVYTPTLDDPLISGSVSCYVILEHDADLGPAGFEAEIVEIGISIEALYSDVGAPKRGSTFVIAGTTYTVKRVVDNDRVFVKVAVNEN